MPFWYNAFTMPTFCTNCGKEAQEAWSFCRSCGNEILPIAGKPVPPPTPPAKEQPQHIAASNNEPGEVPTFKLLGLDGEFRHQSAEVYLLTGGTPTSESKAQTLDELHKSSYDRYLWERILPTEDDPFGLEPERVGKRSLQEVLQWLVYQGFIQRIGQGVRGDPYRYYWGPEAYLRACSADAEDVADTFEELQAPNTIEELQGFGFGKRELQEALNRLVVQGCLKRIGRGVEGDPYRYYEGLGLTRPLEPEDWIVWGHLLQKPDPKEAEPTPPPTWETYEERMERFRKQEDERLRQSENKRMERFRKQEDERLRQETARKIRPEAKSRKDSELDPRLAWLIVIGISILAVAYLFLVASGGCSGSCKCSQWDYECQAACQRDSDWFDEA